MIRFAMEVYYTQNLTNTEKLYGASAILYPNILSYFAKRLKADLYLLPSSIHEVLLLEKEFFMGKLCKEV